MPIRVTRHDRVASGERGEPIAWIGDDEWELPALLEVLENWVRTEAVELERGVYTADIGFSPREGACGGGGVIAPATLLCLAEHGVELWFSEYPMFVEAESGAV